MKFWSDRCLVISGTSLISLGSSVLTPIKLISKEETHQRILFCQDSSNNSRKSLRPKHFHLGLNPYEVPTDDNIFKALRQLH